MSSGGGGSGSGSGSGGRGNRSNRRGTLNWFKKCIQCFSLNKERYDRLSRSSGDSGTPKTPRTLQRMEESLKRSEDSRGKRSEDSKGKRREDSKGKSIALSNEDEAADSNRGGIVIGSSKGMGDVAGSSTGGGDVASSSNNEEESANFWTTKGDRHRFGDVSTAVIQANKILEDFSQVELGRTATYVGIYDGHGGYQTAAYVSRNMTRHLMGRIRNTSTMSIDHLREAFLRTDTAWLGKVDELFPYEPHIAGCGTCCLVGVFWKRTLYVANVGDSRAIIGRAHEDPAKINVHQLTRDDNVKDPEVRAEVQALHPEEPNFVVQDATDERIYRIKGRIQVSKSIGDAYLKRARFNLDRVHNRFKLNAPVNDDNPALSADPSIYTINIEPQDRFVIFASDGLWDTMTNQQAADIVHQYPKKGIAERLVIEGLTAVARRLGGTTYEEVLQYRRDSGIRRQIHDDISVVVVFFDHTLQGEPGEIQEDFSKLSIRQGSVSSGGESNFTALDELVLAEEEGQ